MIALAIILSLLLIVFLLLLFPAKIGIEYKDDVTLYVKYLFLKKQLYPKKTKVKISDYTKKKHRKRLKKSRKPKSEPHKKTKENLTRKQKAERAVSRLKLLLFIVRKIYRTFLNLLTLVAKRIHIKIATDDAAKTAVLYGIAYQSTEYLLAFIDDNIKVVQKHDDDIAVYTDFLSDRCCFDIKLIFKVRPIALLDIGIKVMYNYLIGKKNIKKN